MFSFSSSIASGHIRPVYLSLITLELTLPRPSWETYRDRERRFLNPCLHLGLRDLVRDPVAAVNDREAQGSLLDRLRCRYHKPELLRVTWAEESMWGKKQGRLESPVWFP